jgi:tetratricopeptide (TPR) repeat protein
LDRGEYAQAVEEFRAATQLLPTNALAFNYLGLAFHLSGQPAEAERAYLHALALNHDLAEIHYDLGCLWLGQSNKLEQAKSELTTYLLRQPNSADGWLKLGQAQLRLRELTASEKSLTEAFRLAPQDPETLTSLGWVRYQRKRASEAAQLFTAALKQQPDYSAALLNLAIVAQQDLNDPRLALQKYREYLALKPAPENAQAVSLIVHQLEEELRSPPRAPVTNITVQSGSRTNGVKATSAEIVHSVVGPKPSATNATGESVLAKSEQPTNALRITIPTNAPKQAPVTNSISAEKVEVVKLDAEPLIKSAEDVAAPPAAPRPQAVESTVQYSSSAAAPSAPRQQKRGFFQKINPINLFAHDGKSSSASNPSGTVLANQPNSATHPGENPDRADPLKFPRYSYRSPEQPSSGDRSAAKVAFAQGVQEQQARRLPEAIQSYRRAAQADPSFFDAHYNLGLAATENGNLPLALSAYETALAIEPESLDARYNFGLVLKQAGYALDAVAQFEKILSKYPNDGRTHLALGNLYAQQLQEPSKARQHYLAVLAIAPQSPQAGAIRYWLTDHPK